MEYLTKVQAIQERRKMVVAVRAGKSLREVAAQYGVSAPTVQYWVKRAKGKRLDRVDFSDQPSVPHKVANRTSAEIERQTLQLRRELKEQSDLGEFGAAAIHREMERRNLRPLPAVRTISFILQRYGALDYRVRRRNLPPPLGWYLPEVVAKLAELDQFDFVEGLVIKDGPEVEVLNVVSLHGGLVGAWPTTGCTAESARMAMIEHWPMGFARWLPLLIYSPVRWSSGGWITATSSGSSENGRSQRKGKIIGGFSAES